MVTNITIFHTIICHIKRGSPLILNRSVMQSIIDKNLWLIDPNWYNSSFLAAGRLTRDLSAWHAIFWQPVTNCCDKIFQQLRQLVLEQPLWYAIPRIQRNKIISDLNKSITLIPWKQNSKCNGNWFLRLIAWIWNAKGPMTLRNQFKFWNSNEWICVWNERIDCRGRRA